MGRIASLTIGVALALLIPVSAGAEAGDRAPHSGRGASGSLCALQRPAPLAGAGDSAANNVLLACPSQCSAHVGIIGCDERVQGPTTSTIGKSPYQHVGRFTGPGIGGCTGTLIDATHVLTAAHCALNGNDEFRAGTIMFRLGEFAANGVPPYGVSYGERIFVPKEYTNKSASRKNKALDWAVVELTGPIPGAAPMAIEYVPWFTLRNLGSHTVGYPFDKPAGTAWYHFGSFLDSGEYAWIDGGERGLLYVDHDAAGGQSGSPVYAFVDGKRTVVGVLVGSPESHCAAGRLWAARLTPGTIGLIKKATQFPGVIDFVNLRWSS